MTQIDAAVLTARLNELRLPTIKLLWPSTLDKTLAMPCLQVHKEPTLLIFGKT